MSARGYFFHHGWRAAMAGRPPTVADKLFGLLKCAGRTSWENGYLAAMKRKERERKSNGNDAR